MLCVSVFVCAIVVCECVHTCMSRDVLVYSSVHESMFLSVVIFNGIHKFKWDILDFSAAIFRVGPFSQHTILPTKTFLM